MLKFTSSVMKVGNSLVLVLPKPLCDGFGIGKGDTLDLAVTDKGIYIPIEQKAKPDKRAEALIKEVG
jgi:antitoxin component of MazEF toxin-antitoxin module